MDGKRTSNPSYHIPLAIGPRSLPRTPEAADVAKKGADVEGVDFFDHRAREGALPKLEDQLAEGVVVSSARG